MKTIAEFQKEGMGEIFKNYLKSSWYFETFLDKSILVVLGVLGMWKFFELIVGVFK